MMRPVRVCFVAGYGNLRQAADFRRIYASVLENWWQLPSERVLQRRFEPLKFIA